MHAGTHTRREKIKLGEQKQIKIALVLYKTKGTFKLVLE